MAILFLEFVCTVHTNFLAKSGLCSSRNELVMLNLVICLTHFRAMPVTNLQIELHQLIAPSLTYIEHTTTTNTETE